MIPFVYVSCEAVLAPTLFGTPSQVTYGVYRVLLAHKLFQAFKLASVGFKSKA